MSKKIRINQAMADIKIAEEALRDAEDVCMSNPDYMSDDLFQEVEAARIDVMNAYAVLRQIQEEN